MSRRKLRLGLDAPAPIRRQPPDAGVPRAERVRDVDDHRAVPGEASHLERGAQIDDPRSRARPTAASRAAAAARRAGGARGRPGGATPPTVRPSRSPRGSARWSPSPQRSRLLPRSPTSFPTLLPCSNSLVMAIDGVRADLSIHLRRRRTSSRLRRRGSTRDRRAGGVATTPASGSSSRAAARGSALVRRAGPARQPVARHLAHRCALDRSTRGTRSAPSAARRPVTATRRRIRSVRR